MAVHAQYTPLWWIDLLLPELDKRAKAVELNEKYYDGDHPLPHAPAGDTQPLHAESLKAVRHLLRLGVTNLVRLVADAPAERLRPIGFRLSGDKPDEDKVAWGVWQRNQLDADVELVIGAALQTGQSAMLVWPDGTSGVSVTPETPAQVIVAYEAGSLRRRAAGLKRWIDDDGYTCVTLYLPTEVYKYRSRSARNLTTGAATLVLPAGVTGANDWVKREVKGETWPLRNPFGVVPLVELRANISLRPARFGGGAAEFDPVRPIQDRINKNVFDRLVTAEAQAFRQRVIVGWDPTAKVDPEDHEALAAKLAETRLRLSKSRAWLFANKDVEVHELGQADFTPFDAATAADAALMAAISKTPASYLMGRIENVSAETVKATHAPLVAKCRRHANNFGEALEEIIRLALMIVAPGRAPDVASTVIWADMEDITRGELSDSALKLQSTGAPRRAVWEALGRDPQELERWEEMLLRQPVVTSAQVELAGQLIELGYDPADVMRSLGLPEIRRAGDAADETDTGQAELADTDVDT